MDRKADRELLKKKDFASIRDSPRSRSRTPTLSKPNPSISMNTAKLTSFQMQRGYQLMVFGAGVKKIDFQRFQFDMVLVYNRFNIIKQRVKDKWNEYEQYLKQNIWKNWTRGVTDDPLFHRELYELYEKYGETIYTPDDIKNPDIINDLAPFIRKRDQLRQQFRKKLPKTTSKPTNEDSKTRLKKILNFDGFPLIQANRASRTDMPPIPPPRPPPPLPQLPPPPPPLTVPASICPPQPDSPIPAGSRAYHPPPVPEQSPIPMGSTPPKTKRFPKFKRTPTQFESPPVYTPNQINPDMDDEFYDGSPPPINVPNIPFQVARTPPPRYFNSVQPLISLSAAAAIIGSIPGATGLGFEFNTRDMDSILRNNDLIGGFYDNQGGYNAWWWNEDINDVNNNINGGILDYDNWFSEMFDGKQHNYLDPSPNEKASFIDGSTKDNGIAAFVFKIVLFCSYYLMLLIGMVGDRLMYKLSVAANEILILMYFMIICSEYIQKYVYKSEDSESEFEINVPSDATDEESIELKSDYKYILLCILIISWRYGNVLYSSNDINYESHHLSTILLETTSHICELSILHICIQSKLVDLLHSHRLRQIFSASKYYLQIFNNLRLDPSSFCYSAINGSNGYYLLLYMFEALLGQQLQDWDVLKSDEDNGFGIEILMIFFSIIGNIALLNY